MDDVRAGNLPTTLGGWATDVDMSAVSDWEDIARRTVDRTLSIDGQMWEECHPPIYQVKRIDQKIGVSFGSMRNFKEFVNVDGGNAERLPGNRGWSARKGDLPPSLIMGTNYFAADQFDEARSFARLWSERAFPWGKPVFVDRVITTVGDHGVFADPLRFLVFRHARFAVETSECLLQSAAKKARLDYLFQPGEPFHWLRRETEAMKAAMASLTSDYDEITDLKLALETFQQALSGALVVVVGEIDPLEEKYVPLLTAMVSEGHDLLDRCADAKIEFAMPAF
jgi:hypothetical protein